MTRLPPEFQIFPLGLWVDIVFPEELKHSSGARLQLFLVAAAGR